MYNRFAYIKARFHKPSYLQCSTVDVPNKHGSLLVHGGHEDGALGPQHHPVHLEVHSLALNCEVGELSRLKQLRLKEDKSTIEIQNSENIFFDILPVQWCNFQTSYKSNHSTVSFHPVNTRGL